MTPLQSTSKPPSSGPPFFSTECLSLSTEVGSESHKLRVVIFLTCYLSWTHDILMWLLSKSKLTATTLLQRCTSWQWHFAAWPLLKSDIITNWDGYLYEKYLLIIMCFLEQFLKYMFFPPTFTGNTVAALDFLTVTLWQRDPSFIKSDLRLKIEDEVIN